MIDALLWGFLAGSSLILGGVIAINFNLSKRAIGVIMGFGAGTLISAISYELIFESVSLARGTGFPAYGLFAGALTFFTADYFIERIGQKGENNAIKSSAASLILPMALATILDGIPEGVVIGLGIFEGGAVSLTMLAAVFLSNLPEAVAGTAGMKASGWSAVKTLSLWTGIALLCAVSSLAGFSLFTETSNEWLAFIQSFAGGAILMMISNSMIPEAYEHGKKLAGVATVFGFFVSVSLIVLERM